MRIDPAVIAAVALLEAGCATVPPEQAERERVLMSAIKPCQWQYPAVQVVGLDDDGQLYALVRRDRIGDYDKFERCAKEALGREFKLRPFGAGRLAAAAGPAAVPFQTTAGSGVLVPVLINGVDARLILDTGAAFTVVRPEFAQRAGIEIAAAGPRIPTVVVGGQQVSIPFARAESVSIGAASVEKMEVGVFDALPRLRQADGLLGRNFLNHFKLTIDQERRLVSLEPPRAAAAVAREWQPPAWRPGDEWRLRWQSPTGGGTYVSRVEGEETVDDVEHYVVRSGSRSTYYVKATLGWHFEKTDGAVTRRRSPAPAHEWPLHVGKSWELWYRHEHGDGMEDLYLQCSAADETTLSVPGGVFLTLHVVCRDQIERVVAEWWHAEEAKHWVRQRVMLPDGEERIDELVSYSVKRR